MIPVPHNQLHAPRQVINTRNDKYFSDNMKLTRARQFSHDSPTDIRTYTDVDEQFIATYANFS